MQYKISYKNTRHGYVRLGADGSLALTVPICYKNNTSYIQDLMTKGRTLMTKGEKKKLEKITPIGPHHVLLRGTSLPRPDVGEKRLHLELMQTLYVKARSHLDQYAQQLGKEYHGLNIKRFKSKRGSCSHDNHIVLNLNLVHLDQKYLDYVCCHEICHIKEKNHSSRFRSLVESLLPTYKETRKELKKIMM